MRCALRRARIYPRRYLKCATTVIGNGWETGLETGNDVHATMCTVRVHGMMSRHGVHGTMCPAQCAGTMCTVLPMALVACLGLAAGINPRPTQGATYRRFLSIDERRSTVWRVRRAGAFPGSRPTLPALPGIVGRVFGIGGADKSAPYDTRPTILPQRDGVE